jgi:selenide,water dikinase
VTHRGAKAGDLLYLTKPLGSGLVTTAVKRGLCPPAVERNAVAVMSHLNRDASAAMLESGATAATDVTGYGLIGHLANLAGGADLDLGSIPYMDGVRDLAARDLFSGGSRRNHAAYADQVDWGGVPALDQLMLCDAQTSGGLLVTIPAVNGRRFEAALASGPYPAVRIGTVNGDGLIRVLG